MRTARCLFFWRFENNKGIFADVHRSYKFALMQVVNLPPDSTQPGTIDMAFYVLDASELNDPARHVPYPVETLKALSPEHWTLMELRSGANLTLLEKC